MPYDTNAQLPAYVRQLSSKQQRQWRHVWNSAYSACMNGVEPDATRCESKAFAEASGVVNKGKAKHSMTLKQKFENWLGLTQPDDVLGDIADDLVQFDLGPAKEDDDSLVKIDQESNVILRRGLIFRAGDYPDKDFSLTPKELKYASKQFAKPILIDSEHERSIFDGKLGELISVEANDDGTELHGLVAVPRWLDPILMQAGGKVSAAFDRATKTLVGLALTISPRVSDAALMAAFSVDQAVNGAVSVKELVEMADQEDQETKEGFAAHPEPDADDIGGSPDGDEDDTAEEEVKMPPVSKKKSKFVGYDGMVPKGGKAGQSANGKTRQEIAAMAATNSGRGMMQTIHDVTASRGAVCHVEPQPATSIGPYGIVRYASKGEMDVIQGIHDTTLQHGASCTPTLYGQRDVPGGTPWTWEYPGITNEGRSGKPGLLETSHFAQNEQGSSKAMKAFAKFMEELDEVDPRYGQPAARTTTQNTENDDSRRLDEENARLREENRQMRMQGILDRAVSFADKMIIEGHAVPVEREGIVTVHAQLEHDDTFTAKATFSNGMSRVAAYEASILARPNNLLQAELLPASVQAGLIKFANMQETPKTNTNEYGKMTEERKAQLTGLDPVLKKAYQATHSNGQSK